MLVDLSHYEFVRVSGTDRHTFLQGQLSCDISQLTPEQSLRGALCNLKGRVIADFRVVALGDDIILQCQTGMASVIEGVLKKYAVFSKVDLQVLSGEPHCIGMIGDDCEAQLSELFTVLPQAAHQVCSHDGLLLIRSSDADRRFELWDLEGSNSGADWLAQADKSGLPQWLALEMHAGDIHVTPALSEEYTPQLLNYDISGVINFRKGCYTGQEVVARMYYRAEAKKRLFLYSSATSIDPSLATISVNERHYPVLQVINVEVEAQEEHLLYAVVDVDVAESGEQPEIDAQTGGALSLLPLSYGDKQAAR